MNKPASNGNQSLTDSGENKVLNNPTYTLVLQLTFVYTLRVTLQHNEVVEKKFCVI